MAKVLLVEDDNNLREIYEARLAAEGYDISSAQDGEEALVVAKQTKPDLIVSDVMMPKISGFEMLDILRNTPGLEHVKVIMLTALGQSEDRDRADSLGADKYLVKSQVTLEDIVKTAHELLGDDEAPVADTTTDAVPTMDAAPVTPAPAPETEAVVPAPEPTPAVPPVSAPSEPAVASTDDALAQAAAELTASVPADATEATSKISDQLAGSTAQEQDEVSEQINTFVQEPVAAAPAAEPTASETSDTASEAAVTDAATTADDEIMANAVTELADTEAMPEQPATVEPTATSAADTEPTAVGSEQPEATTAEEIEAAKEETERTNISISGKKTIQPLDSTPKPDINELLAREEANAGNPVTGAAIVSTGEEGNSEPTPTDIDNTPAIVHQPGQSFAPQPQQESPAASEPISDEDMPSGGPAPAPNDKDSFDPNSVAL
jgi:CheY-like chemotaxis protein